ncbi:MAG: hypothetical protein BGO78_11890 [Chloroflexi bacterium 44-23]|nr:MAG: hypothetical protein BGO78_11890 [Chloroflexi bacterium 44-23]
MRKPLPHKLVAPLRTTQNDLRMNGDDFSTIVLILEVYFSPQYMQALPFLQTFDDGVVNARFGYTAERWYSKMK